MFGGSSWLKNAALTVKRPTGTPAFDEDTGRYTSATTEVWSGRGHATGFADEDVKDVGALDKGHTPLKVSLDAPIGIIDIEDAIEITTSRFRAEGLVTAVRPLVIPGPWNQTLDVRARLFAVEPA